MGCGTPRRSRSGYRRLAQPPQAPRTQVELELGKSVGANLSLARLCERRALRASQYSPNTRQELAGTERLGQVIVGAELEPHDAISFIAHASQHDNRYRRLFAQRPGDRHAVLAREAQIEYHEIDRLVIENRRHLLTGRCHADAQCILREVLL